MTVQAHLVLVASHALLSFPDRGCLSRSFMPATTLPDFPDDVRTHPLLIIDYELLKAGDKEEENRLWKAATTLGFW